MKLSLIFAAFLLIYPVQYAKEYYDIENSKQQRTSVGVIDRTKTEEFNCLVSLLYFEARGEGHTGLKYVLSVVENRKNSPRYPDSYCEVMYQPYQFSFVHERQNVGLSLQPKPKEVEKEVFDFIREISYDAVQGNFESVLPENVLHYTTTKVNNFWTRKKKVYIVEGNHKFYLSNR